MKYYRGTQFSIFRIVFGTYLTVHFLELISYGKEIFSNQGVIHDSALLPGYNVLPLHIFTYDNPEHITLFLVSLTIASVLFTFGYFRRVCSLWLFYGWMCLLNRNPLIMNPSLHYIGWLLLTCAFIPEGECLGFFHKKKNKWEIPDIVYYGFLIVVSVSYAASGFHKLQCQSWIDGTALYYVLSGPLGRNNFIVKLLLSSMPLLKFLTWSSLFLEITSLFFGTLYNARMPYWIMFMGFHTGILFTINFTDLTVGMLVTHLFLFDASWFSFTKKLVEKYDNNGEQILNINVYTEKTSDSESSDDEENVDKGQFTMMNFGIPAILVVIIGITINANGNVFNLLGRIVDFTINMYWGFGFIVIAGLILMALERMFPDQELKYVEGWWKWVVIVNVFQLFTVIIASFTWENWLQNTEYFKGNKEFCLKDHVSPFTGGVIAYILNQWLFYWWHRARHEVYILWILFHQFHHSPSRIEAITSFYKHPLEIIADSQIMAVLLYSILGLSTESSIWLSIFSGLGEYIYHMNLRTPKLMGYFFQRPESHRLHHNYMSRLNCPNYSDLPIFDLIGGTFINPDQMNSPTGFKITAETRRLDMLFFKDVILSVHQNIFSSTKKFKQTVYRYIYYFLTIWGSLNSLAFLCHTSIMRGIGFVTVSSPLPLVFTAYNGVETFATQFNADIVYTNGTILNRDLDAERYRLLEGPYHRRNVYGAVFSHGPFFNETNLKTMRQDILHYSVCDPGLLMNEFELTSKIDSKIESVHIDVYYKPTNERIGNLQIDCS